MRIESAESDLARKRGDLKPLLPRARGGGDRQQMRDRRIGRAVAGPLMTEAVPEQRIWVRAKISSRFGGWG